MSLEQEHIDAVERENDELREKVQQLERLILADDPLPIEWGLTATEEKVLRCLIARNLASKEAIHYALYGSVGDEGAEPKIIDVFICKVRPKLLPFGIEIETQWGRGYQLTAASRDAIKSASNKAA
jgi:DNA-binding response OmpR family regulator